MGDFWYYWGTNNEPGGGFTELKKYSIKKALMKVPEHLQHQPIIGVDDYDLIDGQYASDSDAKALSIGFAQYDNSEISAKVFRHTGKTWSRQSEEIPIHRALDIAILIVSTMLENENNTSSLNERIILPNRAQELSDYYNSNQNILRPRLEELRGMLNELLL